MIFLENVTENVFFSRKRFRNVKGGSEAAKGGARRPYGGMSPGL
jgi:hypothetical protein